MNYSYIDKFTDFANDPTPIEELLDEPNKSIQEPPPAPPPAQPPAPGGEDTKAKSDKIMTIIGIVLGSIGGAIFLILLFYKIRSFINRKK